MELASTLPPFLVTLLLLSSYGLAQKYSLRSNSDGSFLLVPANATAGIDNLLVDLADLGPIPVKTNAQEPPGTNSQTPQMIIAKLPKPSASNPAAPAGPQTTSAAPTPGQTAAQTALKPAPQPKPPVTPQVQPPVTQCPGPTCKPKQNLMTLALKGKDGARGKPGSKGPTGPQGQTGSQGKKGPIGQPGICQPTPFQCSPGILATLQAKINALEKQCKSLAGGAAGTSAGGAAGGGAGAGGAPSPPTQPPKQKGPPCNIGKCKENPAANCQVIYIQTPSSISGAFWIRGVKEPFKTLCQFEPMTARGWTLVARIQGSGIEFSPVSNTWADASTINEFSSFDKIATTTMKNRGWSELKQNVMRVCYEGPDKHCADFSHNKGITLTELFNNQFGVEVDEKYTFESLLRAFGKSCDTSRMVRQWCGLNVASICHPQDINPNLNPTNHIARIGCVGDILSTCGPDDFALGLGVSSCYDRYGCAKTHCEMIREIPQDIHNPDKTDLPKGGWTLVARINGAGTEFSPISDNWSNNATFNVNTSSDIMETSSMKNDGWMSLKGNAILLCFTGPRTGCARFTHKRGMTLQELFKTQFGVVPEEQYSFATLLKAFGKSCDLSVLRQGWCGLNMANTCSPSKDDPNAKPVHTTHIVRLGCIGDRQATCFPDDYAVGIGVSSCKDGYGCSSVGQSKNMHYRCDYIHGSFMQTGFLYVL